MRSILEYTFIAALCGVFMMQSAAFAQDKSGSAKSGKPDSGSTEQTDKNTKQTEKAPNGLAPITLDDLAVNLPEVDGWEKGDIQKYPTEEMGFSVNYQSRQGGRVTVYVYNGGNKKIGDGAGDKIVKDELNKAKGEIRQMADFGYYENLKELKNETTSLGANGKNKVLYALYNFGAGDKVAASEIYIFGNQNRFVKIRATRARDNNEAGDKMVADLLKELDAFFSN